MDRIKSVAWLLVTSDRSGQNVTQQELVKVLV